LSAFTSINKTATPITIVAHVKMSFTCSGIRLHSYHSTELHLADALVAPPTLVVPCRGEGVRQWNSSWLCHFECGSKFSADVLRPSLYQNVRHRSGSLSQTRLGKVSGYAPSGVGGISLLAAQFTASQRVVCA
jgi:hypothetical protein